MLAGNLRIVEIRSPLHLSHPPDPPDPKITFVFDSSTFLFNEKPMTSAIKRQPTRTRKFLLATWRKRILPPAKTDINAHKLMGLKQQAD
jgi:hypothetical protein